jgi:hypothetical protein
LALANSPVVSNNEIVEGAIGIIVTNENYQFGDFIHIFNANQKLIKKISISEEKQVLALRCIGKNKYYFKVELEDKKIGYIPRNEKGILFQTWEEHILSLFSIGFDQIKNPICKEPYENADKIQFVEDELYEPNKIKGEWLQIKFGPDNNLQYAWIKWKDKNKLLIDFYYLC